ncbi:discoidin domain-containing protein [Polaribacter batillariae]|uniref:Discoidin domain-containing protein n=1 Tax=Polaribacter batillariae TaxID=2808900 RepID=A0ABX7SZI1_9FLAO|nr:LamG-like jellyroll fold domain-containing protein [Polaribacter batillariae]QTD39109.1 discoidin domain-containing protein [Polaribacter batillariae]
MKKNKIKISLIVFLTMLCAMSTSVFGQELCTSCECEGESNTKFSVDIGEEGGEMGFSEGEILGAEIEGTVEGSLGVAVDIETEALAAIGVTDLVSGVTGAVGALGFIAFEAFSIFEGERMSQIHYDHNVAKIMHGGDFEFPMIPSMHISVEDLNADSNRFSGMFYLEKHMGSENVLTYLKENKADRHVNEVYNISNFNTHTSYAFSTFKDTITGPEGIKDNVITYKYNVPDFTFYTENNRLYYRYTASWKHKQNYTWNRSYRTYDSDSDDYYTVFHNYKMDTGHSKLFEGEVQVWVARLEEDGTYYTVDGPLLPSTLHVEDVGGRLAIRIKDLSLGRPETPWYLIFNIEKPFHFIGSTFGQYYLGRGRTFPENYDPARSDNRFTLTKTWGPDSDTPGLVTVSHDAALSEEDSVFYPDTDSNDPINPRPGGVSPHTHFEGSLFFVRLLDYQARDTEESIAEKEAQGQEADVNVFPEIYTTSQTQFTSGSVIAPEPGKSNLHFDIPYTIGPKKDIDFIELEVLNHPHTIIIDFKGDVNSETTNVIDAYVNSKTSTNNTLVVKGVNVHYRGTSYEEQHIVNNNIISFGVAGEDASFMLLNVPITGGDLVDVKTFYTNNSFSRKLVKMNAVTNNIVKRGYYHIKESHGIYSPANHFLKTDEEGVKVFKQSTSSQDLKPEWLVEYQADGLYAVMDKNSKKALGIVNGQIGVYNWNPDNEALYWQIEFENKDIRGNYPIKLINSSQQAYLATPGHSVQQGETDLVFNFSKGNTFYLERVSAAEPVYVDKKVWLVNRHNNRVLGGNKRNVAKLEVADNEPITNQKLDIVYSGCLTYAIQATSTKEFLYNDRGLLQWHEDKATVFSLNKLDAASDFFTLISKNQPLFNGQSSATNLSLDTNESPDLTDYRYHFKLSDKGSKIDLLAHYKLDDGSTDSSGNAYNGMPLFGYFNPDYVNDPERGMVAHYSTEDHQVEVPYNFDPNTYEGDLTAEIWMKTNIPQYGKVLFNFSTFRLELVHTQGVELAVKKRNNIGGIYDERTTVSNTGVIDNNWHHFAVVIDTQNRGLVDIKVYLDGKEIINTVKTEIVELQSVANNDTNMFIGHSNYGNVDRTFRGYLDDMKIWSKALSPREIETNYVGSDLLVHYEFNDNAEDASGYKRHGINNGVIYVNDGERGKVAKFDGVDDYIDTNFDFHPDDYEGELTASVWMRTDDWGDAYARLLDADSWSMTRAFRDNGVRFYTYHNNTDGLYYWLKYNPNPLDLNLVNLANNDWHHITIVMQPNGNGATLKEIYIDGSFVGANNVSLPFRKREVKSLIGKWSQDYSKNYKGYIDDVKIWKKALSRSEVYNEYQDTRLNLGENLALNKPATQSSTYTSAEASRAVDGNIDVKYTNNSVTHTNLDAQAWWEVDLGQLADISHIKIFNRLDCCSDRLTNYHIFVSDVPFTSNTLSDTQNQVGVSDYHKTGQASFPTRNDVNRTGRYVRVQLEGTNYLTLAEVQVFGKFVSSLAKFALEIDKGVVNNVEEIPLKDLIIYPNASDGHFNIDFGISKVTDVTYNIYNLSGQLLLSERKVFNRVGNHRWEINASQLSDGIYILETTSDLWKERRRIIIK